ncbi:hypothetical protein [uncultured Treponema sp.]|nr:hypothetical protein [uncultured Treponema sp.]
MDATDTQVFLLTTVKLGRVGTYKDVSSDTHPLKNKNKLILV